MSIALNSLYDISCKHPDDYKKAMEWINRLCEKIKRRREINGKYKTSSAVISNPGQAKAKDIVFLSILVGNTTLMI
jgi:hypothetical protein